MDIQARADRTNEAGEAVSGSLGWNDETGNRYHVWVHLNPVGIWQLTEAGHLAGNRGGLVYKNPARGLMKHDDGWFRTKNLDHNSKANAKTVAYVLEKQNAHHLIEEAQRDRVHATAQREADTLAGHAAFMRGALRKMAEEITDGDSMADSTAKMNLYGLAGGLTDAQLNRLSAHIHDCAS